MNHPSQTFTRRLFLKHVPVAVAAMVTAEGIVSRGRSAEPRGRTAAFDPRDFGAAADGRTLDTAAIQQAIDACAAAGGGTVVLQGGSLLSGTIRLKNHVTLRIEAGARLVGSPRIADYQATEMTLKNIAWALILAEKAENVGIDGPGVIECSGASFAGEFRRDGKLKDSTPRPVVVRLNECRRVRLQGFVLRDYPAWGLHLTGCREVVIDGLSINCFVQPNNDGIDLWDCEKVFVSNCAIFSGDDCIAIYSEHGPCTDITITNCQLSTPCQAIRIGPHSVKNLERITATNCILRDVGHSGICLQMCQGGVMRDLMFSNIIMENVVAPITLRLGGWQSDPKMTWSVQGDDGWEKGAIRNVLFQNIRAKVPAVSMEGTRYEVMYRDNPRLVGFRRSCIHLMGTPRTTIENVRFSDLHVTFPGGGSADEGRRRDVPEMERTYPTSHMFGILPSYGLFARHVRGLSLHNVRFDLGSPDCRPALVCDDVEDLDLLGFRAAAHPQGECLARLRKVRRVNIANSGPLSPVRDFLQVEETDAEELLLNANDLRLVNKS